MSISGAFFAQLPVARDTITVIENNYVLKMPWANGINYSNVSSADLNFDGKKDLVVFDRMNEFGIGRFRCFIKMGNAGEAKFREEPFLPHYFPQAAYWAVMRDYNCDGKEDLFCSTSGGIRVYRNVSTPANNLSFKLVKAIINSDYYPPGPPYISNLYASPIGVPGIVDIDGDGDLDILTFSPDGTFIEYHKNISKEAYGHCDSLEYEYTDNCWGKISESNCTVNLGECAPRAGKIAGSGGDAPQAKEYHAGSCLTCLDSDSDGDQDLIMGDVSCKTVQYVHNSGTAQTADFSDTTKLYPNYPNPNTTQIRMNIFPCAYYLDVDGDNKNDLIATPNTNVGENYKSVWYYKNTSSTGTVNFQFVKNNFLQDEMIDVGQNSFPVVFDHNADGKKDLLIGTFGYYTVSAGGNNLGARLTLYENTGSPSQPSYSLITRDYAGIGQYNLSYVMPTAGDIDNDGDVDLCLGTSNGKIHWLENTAGAGNVCNFSVFKNNPFSFITGSSIAAPQLFDLDNDGKLDLLIGTKNGRIAYYRNTGTQSVPAYSLVTNFLGNIDVKGDPYLYGSDGHATPYFYKEGSAVKLLVGSVSGTIFHYSVPPVLTDAFNLITAQTNNFNEGAQSTVCYEDVNNDGKRDLFIGNAGGGLSFYSSSSPFVGIRENDPAMHDSQVSVFPNPADHTLNISIRGIEIEQGVVVLLDMLGKEVLRSSLHANSAAINISDLGKGMYFASFRISNGHQNFNLTKKIIKE